MIVRKTLNVSLTPELHDFVYGLAASGTYCNVSEVVRAGLRMLERDESTARRKRRRTPASDRRRGLEVGR